MKTKRLFSAHTGSFIALVALTFLLAGCVAESIVWSPDGRHAAVLGQKGLYLCDADGKLSGLLVPDVSSAAWFPDSQHLALARTHKYRTWASIKDLLPSDLRARIETAAQAAIAAMKGGREFNRAIADADGALSSDATIQFLLCLDASDEARRLAGPNQSYLDSSVINCSEIIVASLNGDKVTLGSPLTGGLEAVVNLCVSPGGAAIAYVTKGSDQDGHLLRVVPVDGSAPAQTVAENTAIAPDWSPDGRSLYCIKGLHSAGDNAELDLGAFTRRGILNDAGRIQLQEKPDELAGVIFEESASVHCLPDGRVLFSALEIQLPITKEDFPQREQLYLYDPHQGTTLIRVSPRGIAESLPANLDAFEVSPDGKRVSFLGDKHQVAILTLASGNVQTVQPPVESDLDDTLPVWRSSNQLCYLSFPTNSAGGPPEFKLWQDGFVPTLSADWPADVRKGLLEK
jgi:hypothetical protein